MNIMGSACCVAARDKTLPHRTGSEYSHRNIRHSPSWSFRWDNRTHSEDGINRTVQLSRGNTRNIRLEFKSRLEEEIEAISDGGSPVESFQTPTWQKSPAHEEASGNFRSGASDFSKESSFSNEEKDFEKSSTMANASSPKLSVSVPSSSSSSTFNAEPSSSQSNLLPTMRAPSRRAHCSPGHQFSRKISDSRVPAFKSPGSNDLTFDSHGGSSDGWSMRTFSELVASSQRERWSFDSENMSFGHGKITRSSSNSPLLTSPSMDVQTCGICSKQLDEFSIVAVLVCGHAFHAECLEKKTSETDKYDPSCPLCTAGARSTSKMFRKALRLEADSRARNKISRIRVADCDDIDGNDMSNHIRRSQLEGKGPKMVASSSMRSSFGRPFLSRHFSIGSKSSRPLPEKESTRKKGFWARYQRE